MLTTRSAQPPERRGCTTGELWQLTSRQATVSYLVNWRLTPSQPQRIISGLKETVIKRYMLKRTNKAEIRLEEDREKTESCRENLWNEILLKRP